MSIRALIITGGHGFQEQPFWEIFDSFCVKSARYSSGEDFSYDAVTFPDAFEHINIEGTKNYDVLVFYDMWQEITPAQQEAYLELLNHGKPIIYLHHALISFPDWPEFGKIVGGYWKRGEGTVKHDVQYTVQIADANHPVTAGMKDFEIQDETYGNFSADASVHPLLKADHPESAPVIGWAHQYANSPIVYLQLGHDSFAYGNPNYRRLINQGMHWVVSAAT